MSDFEIPCAPSHRRVVNDWLRQDEPTPKWFVQPSRLGKDFIKHVKIPEPASTWTRRNEAKLIVLASEVAGVRSVQQKTTAAFKKNSFFALFSCLGFGLGGAAVGNSFGLSGAIIGGILGVVGFLLSEKGDRQEIRNAFDGHHD